MAAATIKDVAELAGCSIASVSRYLNGTAPLAVETRDRIRDAIAQLEYRPSELGRSLKRQASRTIGMIVPSFTNPIFASSIAGLQEAARLAGFGVLVASSEYDPDLELAAVETFLGQAVDGIALTVCDVMSSPALAILDAVKKPHVLLYNHADSAERTALTVDNVSAAREMTDLLLDAGHQRIVFVAGRFAASDRSRLRYRGFAAAMAARGLAPPHQIEVDFRIDEPDAAFAPIFDMPEQPTALFCSNDILALAAIGAVRRVGLSVPADITIVGFDGIAVGAMLEPPLTTVIQPARDMGEKAMQVLLDRFAGNAVSQGFVAHEIRRGGSVAAPAAETRHATPAGVASQIDQPSQPAKRERI